MSPLRRFIEIINVLVCFSISGLYIFVSSDHPEDIKYYIVAALGWFLAGGYRLNIWMKAEE